MRKRILAMVLICAAALSLFGCGKKNMLEGYYTYRASNSDYALEIKGSKAIMYTNNHKYDAVTEGKVKVTDKGVDITFEDSKKDFKFANYNPMHAAMSESGKRLELSSDSSSWVTDEYRIATEESFTELVDKIKKARNVD